MKKKYSIIIIGAGPAGIFCALQANKKGVPGEQILLLDKNKRPGAKLLLTGNGRCNLSSDIPIEDFIEHYFEKRKFVYPAITFFGPKDLQLFFESRGLRLKKEGEKIYPASDSANDVLVCLEKGLAEAKISYLGNTEICNVFPLQKTTSNEQGSFEVETTGKSTFSCDALVIATGGLSFPKTGSTGFAYQLAKKLNIKLVPTNPALVGLIIDKGKIDLSSLAGISIADVGVELCLDRSPPSLSPLHSPVRMGKVIARENGDVLFTHDGISGPAILNLSRYFAKNRNENMALRLKLLEQNHFSHKDTGYSFEEYLSKIREESPGKQIKTSLQNIFPKQLLTVLSEAELLSKEVLHLLQLTHEQVQKENILSIQDNFNNICLPLKDVHGFGKAIITTGGISTKEVFPHSFESKQYPRLYFIGECLDVDGKTGGFNLQFAFSSGALAASSLAASVNKP